MLNHIVIDNVFSDPDSVESWAKRCYYYSSNEGHPNKPPFRWVGHRSDALHKLDFVFYRKIHNEIVDKVIGIKKLIIPYSYNYETFSHFHYLTSENVFEKSWIHKDETIFGGVVYLNKNHMQNYGTMLYDESNNLICEVENQYNRLVMYNGGVMHSAKGGFGGDVNDARLSLVFFVGKFMIKRED